MYCRFFCPCEIVRDICCHQASYQTPMYVLQGRRNDKNPRGRCVLKWGFMRTFPGNQDATLKLMSELILHAIWSCNECWDFPRAGSSLFLRRFSGLTFLRFLGPFFIFSEIFTKYWRSLFFALIFHIFSGIK